MVTILISILWIAYAVLEGIREARYFDCFPVLPKFNVHIIFTLQRLSVILILAVLGRYWLVFPLAMIFPFVHDGVYYYTRHKLNKNVYVKGFWSDPSYSSTAYLDLKLRDRIIWAIIGTGLIILLALNNVL